MKRVLMSCMLLLSAGLLFGASAADLVTHARAAYEKGDAAQALTLLGQAASGALTAAEKKTLADAYVTIGTAEYDRANWKNAFECFKAGVKLAPTNQAATKYYWKMKRETDVASLTNEGDARKAKAEKEKDANPAAAQAATAIPSAPAATAAEAAEKQAAPPAAAEDAVRYQETLAKLSKTEQELAALRVAAEATAKEGAAMKAELTAEQARQAAAAEAERQRLLKENEQERQKLLQSVEQQRQQMARDNEAERQRLARESEQERARQQKAIQGAQAASADARQREELIARQKDLMDQRLRETARRTWMGLAGVALLLIAAFVVTLFVMRGSSRRARGLPGGQVLAAPRALGGADTQVMRGLLPADGAAPEFYPDARPPAEGSPASNEASLYRELIRAERIRRMHDQMKQGALRWDTLREYVGELEKDLRGEVLKVAETKILEGDGVDPRAILPVLYPFLTDTDDYLRDKAEALVRRSILSTGEPSLLSVLSEEAAGAGTPVLRLERLQEIPDKLKKVLRERDRSMATARISRGMARMLGFSSSDAEMLYKAALAHDAGYLLLDGNRLGRILGRPEITPADRKYIQSHAQKGLSYFKGARLPREFTEGILYHHERNDGSGYPKGLTGAEIPVMAKIIGVAETFVALNGERPHRGKQSPDAALAVIRDGAGTRFDREHVDVLAELVHRTGAAS